MEKIIYDNVSLQYIVNAINTGIVGLDEDENFYNFIIYSKLKPGVLIKLIDFDITDKIISILETGKFVIAEILNMKEVTNNYSIERDVNDFIVFVMDSTEKILKNMSLTEYIVSSKLLNNENILEQQNWILSEIIK